MISANEEARTGAGRALARLSMMMAAVALSGCGGGGNGGGSAAPPPATAPAPPAVAPTLAVRADAASVHAGEAPVALHATLAGTDVALAWSLSGPGTLSSTTGPDVTYIPPSSEHVATDEAATITVTAASAGIAPQSVAISVSAVDVPGHHWTMVRPSAKIFTDVVHANGTFLALHSAGYSISPDGLAWTDVTSYYEHASAVTWGDAGWIGIDANGDAFTSVDGLAWSMVAAAIPASLEHIVFGNHVYLAYGYTNAAVSSDGVHWTLVDQSLTRVAFGNGKFLAMRQTPGQAVRDLHPWVSADGAHWQAATDPGNLFDIAFFDGQFVAPSNVYLQATSDGSTWIGVPRQTALGPGLLSPAGGALFELEPYDMGVQVAGSGWQRAGTGSFLSMPAAVAADAGRYVGVSWDGWITTSVDALNWSTQVEGSWGDLRSIAVVGEDFVAVSSLGQVLRSHDGVDWTKAGMLAGNYAPLLFPEGLAQGGGTLVSVGSAGNLAGAGGSGGLWLRSLDGGLNWARAATTPPAEGLIGVVYDGHRFIAVSTTGVVYASPDGDAWGRIGNTPATTQVDGLAFGGGVLLEHGVNGAVATSIDGVTWTPVDPTIFGGPAGNLPRLGAVYWDGTRFIATGSWVSANYAGLGAFAALSPDGRQWTVKSDPRLATAAAVTRCGNEYVLVGNALLASSVDGLNWTSHALVTPATQINAVACNSGRFVAVGWGSAIVTSTR